MATQIRVFPTKWLDWRPPSECWDFGIGEILAATLPEIFATEAGAATIGATALGSALPGAAFGAATSGITGGNPLLGALTGGLTGGAVGAGGFLAPELGISPLVAKTLAGGAGGLIGSEITGQNPLIGGLTGAGGGLLSGALSGGGSTPTPGFEGGGPTGAGGGPAVASSIASSTAPLSGEIPTGTGSNFLDLSGGGTEFGNTTGTALTSTGGGPTSLTGSLGGASGNAATGGGAGGTGTSDIIGQAGSSGGGPGDPPTGTSSNFVDIGGGSEGNWLSNAVGTTGNTDLGSRIVNYLGDNPMLGVGGALLGGSLLMGNGSVPGSGPLKQNSAALTTLGNQEISGLQTGQVPPGAQSLLDQSRSAMDATTRSRFASLGLTGSTMEAQTLAQNAQSVETNKWQIINDLLGRGTQALGTASNINTTLMNTEIAKDQAMQQAIARFAAALAGGAMTQKQAA